VLVPAVLQLRRQASRVAGAVEELRGEFAALAGETREAIGRVSALSGRVEREWSQIERTLALVRGWTERADAVLGEVDAAVTPPLLGTARAVGLARVGLAAFWDALRRGRPAPGHATPTEGDPDVR